MYSVCKFKDTLQLSFSVALITTTNHSPSNFCDWGTWFYAKCPGKNSSSHRHWDEFNQSSDSFLFEDDVAAVGAHFNSSKCARQTQRTSRPTRTGLRPPKRPIPPLPPDEVDASTRKNRARDDRLNDDVAVWNTESVATGVEHLLYTSAAMLVFAAGVSL